jgi:hypothetical protein
LAKTHEATHNTLNDCHLHPHPQPITPTPTLTPPNNKNTPIVKFPTYRKGMWNSLWSITSGYFVDKCNIPNKTPHANIEHMRDILFDNIFIRICQHKSFLNMFLIVENYKIDTQ